MELSMIDDAALSELIARLASRHDREREEAADSVTDLTTAYSADQARRLVAMLTRLAANEADPASREAQLHAAAELVEWHPVARAAAEIESLDPATLSPSEREYVEYLAESDGDH
jgi:hypothetical protein